MIRIQLQPRSRRLVPFLLLGLGVFLVSALGLSYLTRSEFPSLPPGQVAVAPAPERPAPRPESEPEVPAPRTGEPQIPAEGPRKTAPVLPPAREPAPAPEQLKAPPAEEARSPQRGEAKAVPLPAPGWGAARTQAPALPAAGPLCLRVLQLHERLPPGVRCSSLSGTAGGDYVIEGTIPGGDFPQLIVLLDGLLRLPSKATLSRSREGKNTGDYNFNLHGQFPAAAQAAPAPLEASQVAGLFSQALALARKSRLDSVRVGAPLSAPMGKGVVQQRQKLWATGSYQQLKSFVETLVRQQPQLRLEEVMLVPQHKGETQWKQAQFYAVLSAAVRAPR